MNNMSNPLDGGRPPPMYNREPTSELRPARLRQGEPTSELGPARLRQGEPTSELRFTREKECPSGRNLTNLNKSFKIFCEI